MHIDEEYTITQGHWHNEGDPMLEFKIPGISAIDLRGKEIDAVDVVFQWDKETARVVHRLMGCWLDGIND